ncbi:transcriptional regulator family: Fungal Specific TF [Purpureocillium lilacinum]|uniref:Transcriptional regulator family: Fungal Specific TF n=1 Tax=Purpureocillium lilacinum TaxID=33203 RepID=A0ABR0C8G8_PURLI|nr:transcriptional regulator family: Fungal Specific TF [Purpureocillium lilacinum]
MRRAVGPLDKRRRVTRCQACAQRRIKCQGGPPCDYCVRTSKTCRPQAPRAAPNVTAIIVACHPPPSRNRSPPTPDDALFLDCFASFLQRRCHLTQAFVAAVATDLARLVHESAPVGDLAVAIGALDASRHGAVMASRGGRDARCAAFRAYGRAMRGLQARLSDPDAVTGDDVVWGTFLLGLFELMAEASGDGWATHMFYGTARVLQLAGPARVSLQQRRGLFGAFRVLEATRVIMYGEETFLAGEAWRGVTGVDDAEADCAANPMAEVLDLMIRASSFSKRFFKQIENIPPGERPCSPVIDDLARQGVALFRTIHAWEAATPAQNPFADLARANHLALELFFCKNFTYYDCWLGRQVPRLEAGETDAHVEAVLRACEAVQRSNIPGALLLFPLRMAGANTADADADRKERILKLLGRVHAQGFVVADRIKVDLHDFWQHEEQLAQAR